jgi:hypothetical protein
VDGPLPVGQDEVEAEVDVEDGNSNWVRRSEDGQCGIAKLLSGVSNELLEEVSVSATQNLDE